ncbi:hypothetical protein V2G26_000288 [Clonostachys chloroleuca]
MMIKAVEDSLKPQLGRINHSRQNSGWGIPCASDWLLFHLGQMNPFLAEVSRHNPQKATHNSTSARSLVQKSYDQSRRTGTGRLLPPRLGANLVARPSRHHGMGANFAIISLVTFAVAIARPASGPASVRVQSLAVFLAHCNLP